jgi:two-component system nitrogen regulation sensor histidine kinase GlnL
MKGTLAPARPRRQAPVTAERWLDAAPIAIIGVDEIETIRFVNAAAAEAIAGHARGLVGRALDDVFGAASTIGDLARAALSRGQTVMVSDLEVMVRAKSLGHADATAAPLDDGRGAILTLVWRAKGVGLKAAPVSAAARTLAHEVRNPLAGIRAAAQLIAREASSEVADLTNLICDEVDRIRRLTDRIDALEGLAPPRLGRVNVHQALERVRQIIASSFPDVLVQERYDPSLPQIEGDLDQLIQAFLNVAKNAAEAVRGQTEPVVVLATGFRPGLKVRSAAIGAARPQLEVSIEDNGPGLPAALQGRVFEPFFTTKRGGQGLGLAVASEIVARHDGRIETESAPGRTLFRIVLPLAKAGDPQ